MAARNDFLNELSMRFLGKRTLIRSHGAETKLFVALSKVEAFNSHLESDIRFKTNTFDRIYDILDEDFMTQNPFFNVFELGPVPFGTWSEDHISSICPELLPREDRHHDKVRILNGHKARIEVKIGSAKEQIKAPVKFRALHSSSNQPHKFGFNRVDDKNCELIVAVGLYTDVVKYWVLTLQEGREHFGLKINHSKGSGSQHMAFEISSINFGRLKAFECAEADLLKFIDSKLDSNYQFLRPVDRTIWDAPDDKCHGDTVLMPSV